MTRAELIQQCEREVEEAATCPGWGGILYWLDWHAERLELLREMEKESEE